MYILYVLIRLLFLLQRSDYLYREVVKTIADYPNVYIPDWSLSTIWGGASLLTMLLHALGDIEYKLSHWKWDFFINLSESDFPLKYIGEKERKKVKEERCGRVAVYVVERERERERRDVVELWYMK